MKLSDNDLAQAYRDMRAAKRTRLAQESRRDAGEQVDPAALARSAEALRIAHERIGKLLVDGSVEEMRAVAATPVVQWGEPRALPQYRQADVVFYEENGEPGKVFRLSGVSSYAVHREAAFGSKFGDMSLTLHGAGYWIEPEGVKLNFPHRNGRPTPSDATLMGALARADAGSSAPELLAKAEAALGAVLDFLNAPLGTSAEQRNALAEKAASAVRGYDQAYGLKR